MEVVLPSVGREEVERAVPVEAVGDADPAAEVGQIGATAHRDVLRVVEHLSGSRFAEGADPAAEHFALFEKLDGDSPLGQGHGRRHSGQPAADNADGYRIAETERLRPLSGRTWLARFLLRRVTHSGPNSRAEGRSIHRRAIRSLCGRLSRKRF